MLIIRIDVVGLIPLHQCYTSTIRGCREGLTEQTDRGERDTVKLIYAVSVPQPTKYTDTTTVQSSGSSFMRHDTIFHIEK